MKSCWTSCRTSCCTEPPGEAPRVGTRRPSSWSGSSLRGKPAVWRCKTARTLHTAIRRLGCTRQDGGRACTKAQHACQKSWTSMDACSGDSPCTAERDRRSRRSRRRASRRRSSTKSLPTARYPAAGLLLHSQGTPRLRAGPPERASCQRVTLERWSVLRWYSAWERMPRSTWVCPSSA